MIVPVYDHSDAVRLYVSRNLFPGGLVLDGFGIGFANETEGIVAGIVYHNWHPEYGCIEITAFADRRDWLNKDRLRAVFSYPFEQLKARVVVARISERNTRVLALAKRFGAELTPIPDLRADGEADVVAVLRRDTWLKSKFSGGDHGRTESTRANAA